jgi:poly(3-hydroxybutyrate) depolymerase
MVWLSKQFIVWKEFMKKSYWLAIGLALVIALTLWNQVAATGPPEDDPDQDDGRRVGLVSTEAKCLAVQSGIPDSASATVRLQWEGQIEEAFLVLSAAGSEGGHSIYVNGRFVGRAPVRPDGQPCEVSSPAEIPIPPEVLVEGENVIVLTNDANPNDGWTAANLRLEIHGILSGPPVAVLEAPSPTLSPPDIGATAVISDWVLLTSSYDGIQQVAWYQVPDCYTGSTSVPLLIGIHGMGSGSGQGTRDFLATEADSRCWLLAAPDMHGNYHQNTGQYALAWPGAQHDIIDTIVYMMDNYNVDTSRIYVTGGSMGGQTTAMMAAKYPDVFAAAVPWKPLTDLTDWYYELDDLDDPYDTLPEIRRETGGTFTGTTPPEAPFEYQRRSPIEMPQNSQLIPIKMWHDEDDLLVPIHHSIDFRDAVNDHWNPPTPVTLIEVGSGEYECPTDPYDHCYNPLPADIFDFLSGFTLNTAPPISLTIRTDESKPFYWLNFAQTGGDHWSEVEAAYSLASETVTATISDTQPLTLAFNLASTPIIGPAGISRPGTGLPATTYLVSGGGNYKLEDYTSGYLTVPLTTTGQFTLTISAIGIEVSADPSTVPAGQIVTSTITAVVKDRLNSPVPDGTTVEFSTTEGTFPNASLTYMIATIGGQATTTLTLDTDDNSAQVVASVGSVTDSTIVNVIFSNIYLPVVVKNSW